MVPTRSLACASLLLLASGAVVLAAEPASACPAPTSGTGFSTCRGDASLPMPSTTGGTFCINALCPSVQSTEVPGFCVEGWAGGRPWTVEMCVPTGV